MKEQENVHMDVAHPLKKFAWKLQQLQKMQKSELLVCAGLVLHYCTFFSNDKESWGKEYFLIPSKFCHIFQNI